MFASRADWSLAPNRLTQQLEEHRRQGLPVLDLTESNPTRCGFQYDTAEVLGALADPRALTYEPEPRGLEGAREAVAGYYAERGARVGFERVFLTTSTSEAYSYVFRLLADSGDNILAPAPSYPLFDFLARLHDLDLLHYPLTYDHGWHVELQTLRERIKARTRAVVVVHPNNPTGSFLKKDELEFLLECCREHSLALVADEVFADYPFGEDARRVGSHAEVSDVLTFTLSGLSKISALPQMKLAWIVASGPAQYVEDALARLEVIADTYLSVSTPQALALRRLLNLRRKLQPQICERLRANLRWLDAKLSRDSPVSRLEAEGGWYVILRVPSIRSDEDWAIELLEEEGVLVHPGHFYDFSSEGHLVVSLLPRQEVFEQGMEKILARLAQG